MSETSTSGGAPSSGSEMLLGAIKSVLADLTQSLPNSEFRLSLTLYVNGYLFGRVLVDAIKEDFLTVEDRYGDPALTETTIRILRDLLVAKQVVVDRRQGVRINRAVAAAIYGSQTLDTTTEALVKRTLELPQQTSIASSTEGDRSQ
jgi:hypothetical protein